MLKWLRHHGRFDGWVLLGEKEHRLRVVALPVPQEVAQRRRSAAKHNRDRRCVPTQQRLALMTGRPAEHRPPRGLARRGHRQGLSAALAHRNDFQSLKSHLRLRELNCHSADLVRLSVLLKLLYCLLTTRCFDALARLGNSGRQVSLLRFSHALGHCGLLLTAALLQISPQDVLAHYLEKHAFYERRTDRKNFCQHLTELVGGLA